MRFPVFRCVALIVCGWSACGGLYSQTPAKPPASSSKIEPGLELAVNWKWWVTPPEKTEWGMPLPEALMPKAPGALEPGKPAEVRPETYAVKKGDAIIKVPKNLAEVIAGGKSSSPRKKSSSC